MLKLGLTQRVVVDGYEERRDCLDQAWARRLEGYLPIPLPNSIRDVGELVDALALDGVILTGGNDLSRLPEASDPAPERDAFERRLIDAAAARELPLLGVCRGLQLLVTHYGGRLTPIPGHAGQQHEITAVASDRAPLGGRRAVNSFHRYGVRASDLGTGLRVLATAADGSVEAVVHERLPQWGIMWHPERPPHDPRDLELLEAIFGSRVR